MDNFIDGLKEKAMDNFNEWNDVTGIFERNTGYYAEIEGVIDDTVKQVAEATANKIKTKAQSMDIRSFYCDFDDYCNEIINQCKGDSHVK